MKKRIFCVITCILLCLTWEASACSLFYFGGDYTDDRANLFVRIEDGDLNDENKLYLVTPAGKHKAGEEYHGCYGYTWTYTHDSYRYVSRRDDNLADSCPVCGSIHELQSYEEAIALTNMRFAEMQKEFETRFDNLTTRLKKETDLKARQETATEEASRMAEEAQNLAMALYRHFVYGEALPEE